MAKKFENVVAAGHEYTAEEIMRLPERALSMGGNSETHARLDADRNVAFPLDPAGRLIPDGSNRPKFYVIMKRGQVRQQYGGAASDDMLRAISNARKQMSQSKGKNGTKQSAFNLTFMLIGLAITVIPIIALLFLLVR